MLKKFKEVAGHFSRPFSRKSFTRQVVTINDEHYLIREISANDIKKLLDLERVVYIGEVPWTRSAFLSELYSPLRHLYLCVEKAQQMVAFAGARIAEDDAHITNIAVHPDFQSQGIGGFLLDEMEKFAKRNHCQTLSLEVRMSNKEAQRLYRKKGYVSRAIKTGYYDQSNEDALDMVKVIEENV